MKRLGLAVASMLGVACLSANAHADTFCAKFWVANSESGGMMVMMNAFAISDLRNYALATSLTWNDVISSYQLQHDWTNYRLIHLYSDINYGGNVLDDESLSTAAGSTKDVMSMPSGWNDAVSSIACSVIKNPPKRVFVSSALYYPNLGNLTGADAACQALANAASQPLKGTWKAWLSSGGTAAKDRISHSSGPYVLLDGTVVADNYCDLVADSSCGGNGLNNAITMDESFNSPSLSSVWTNTNADGTITGSVDCVDWQSSSTIVSGNVGTFNTTGSGWTSTGTANCHTTARLYCFEQ